MVRRILQSTGTGLEDVIGNAALLRGLAPEKFTDARFGVPTVSDILSELEKPGRDPRPAFTTATFADGVEKISDLREGMVLEGVVTNVAAFGAFVDVGVHQDGLVHVSAMSNRFVSDPREIVKSGQVVKVKVMEVDPARQRIALTLRLDDQPGTKSSGTSRVRDQTRNRTTGRVTPTTRATPKLRLGQRRTLGQRRPVGVAMTVPRSNVRSPSRPPVRWPTRCERPDSERRQPAGRAGRRWHG